MLVIACVQAARHRRRSSASLLIALVAYVGISWLFARHSTEFHQYTLWELHSQDYKAKTLAQPESSGGTLKHIDWYGWGGFGSDTDVYLAYDPTNSLNHKDSVTGKYGQLHCDVWKVHRLEDKWYAVTFYTNQAWDESCGATMPSP